MKFLVCVTPRPTTALQENPIAILKAAKEWVNDRLADGSLDCGYNVVGSKAFGGIAIANADSHEALMEQLLAYPQFPFVDIDTYPLSDINHYFDKHVDMLQKRVSG